MAGILEAIRDNLEYVQDYQEVQKNTGIGQPGYSTETMYKPWLFDTKTQQQSDSFTNQVLADLEEIQPKESVNITEIALIGGAVVLGLLLIRGFSR